MEHKAKKTKIILIILFVIAVTLSIIMFSTTVNALNKGEVMPFRDVKQFGDLARFIAYRPNAFLNLDVNDIFNINSFTNGQGSGYQYAHEPLNNSGSQGGFNYCSGMCIFHFHGNKTTTKGWGNIVNVIDIKTPGELQVFGNGSSSKATATTNSGVINLTAENEKKSMTALAYTLYQATLYERVYENGKWTGHGTLTKDLSNDNNISGWNRMYYDINGTTLLQIKHTISHLMIKNDANRESFTSILGKYAKDNIDFVYSGLLNGNGYNLTPSYSGETSETGQFLTNALTEANNHTDVPTYTVKDKNASVHYTNGESTAYIGPFVLNYTYGTPSIQIDGISSDKIYGWTRKSQNGGFKGIEKPEELTAKSNEEFYIAVNEQALRGLSNIKVNIKLTYNSYRARIVFTSYPYFEQQNLMFYAAVKEDNAKTVEWVVPNAKEITIQKIDASKKAIKVSGIKFNIYNQANKYVGTLETNQEGKTNAIKIGMNQEYTIKEVKNDAYGYKNSTITNATITSGKGTIQVSNGDAKVKVSEDAVIAIENTPELGNLTISKTNEGNKALEGVQFVLWKGSSYLKLNEESVTNPIVTPDSGLDITKYNVTNVDSIAKATKFRTNASGKIVINNLEIYSGKDTKYSYWLEEIKNNNYGYKGMNFGDTDVTITGGKKIEVRTSIRGIKLEIGNNNITTQIKNNQQLANIEIQKVGENNTSLEGVEFAIRRDTDEFIQLKDGNGAIISSIKGLVTINKRNIANSTEYSIAYVSNKNEATKFITDSNGKITINNVEVDKSSAAKHNYTAYEIFNPNYGYGSGNNTTLSETVTSLMPNQTSQIKINNTIDLGNLSIEKHDEDNSNIKLENVGFALEISPSPEKAYAYLALYDVNGNIVLNAKGIATINRKNIATENEYEARYYCTDKPISELSDAEKQNITTFITESDGTLSINNLEVHKTKTGEKYNYKLIEVSNLNYGFIANSQEFGNITFESNPTVNKKLPNKQILTKLSGYVWIEKPLGKSNNYDGVYTEGSEGSDVKLKDLYITQGGLLIKNPDAQIPVEIKLRDKETGAFIKERPDEFNNETGEYVFKDVLIEKLRNYEVVFIYDGFYYTTVVEQLGQGNGSKVKEVKDERITLNDKFGTVRDDANNEENKGEIVSKDKKSTAIIEYKKESNHLSTVDKIAIDTAISANTTLAGYNIGDKYNAIKQDSTDAVEGINNINMGIVLREQPKLAIGSDIYSALVDVNNKHYTYYYNGRQQHYEKLNNDEVGVKFEQETANNRYTRPVYSSDVDAYKNGQTTMGVSLIYKLQITNQSRTLTSVVKEITNYFDADYQIEEIGLSLSNNKISDLLDSSIWSDENITNDVNVEYESEEMAKANEDKSYNSILIPLSENGKEGLTLEAKESKNIYIKFNISESAIKGLVTGESTYHNATEIMSYSTYYSEETSKVNGTQFITDTTPEGSLYAGIDRSSQPGNIELKLVKDTRDGEENQTPILDTGNYEDDTASAPSLILEATESRKISGTIFEDKATAESETRNEKIGNGIYNAGENTIDGVIVELYETNGNLAKYSDGTNAIAKMDGKGNYTFGYDDETTGKHAGILPGTYIIHYTYNNESFIIDTNGNKVRNLNVNDYKSTIITSRVIRETFENASNLKWYLEEEKNSEGQLIRYSDAKDDWSLRNDIEGITSDQVVNQSTYKDLIAKDNKMVAYTPTLEIGIEFTKDNLENGFLDFDEEFSNVDFGIIERPNVDIKVKKQITGLELVTQTGASIIPKGDPTDVNSRMQYVKNLANLYGEQLVSAEIEAKLLQGARLNLEYSITVENNSDIDYLEKSYYYYGENGTNKRKITINTLVDYLDSTMRVTDGQTGEGTIWTEKTAEDLWQGGNGLITKEAYDELKTGNYHILTTDAFNEIDIGDKETVKLYTSRVLAVSAEINETNSVEIIELKGGRTIKDSIPGNLVPSKSSEPGDYIPSMSSVPEPDNNTTQIIITTPTGTTVNYMLYIIAVIATFAILVLGIIIIKKKVIK